MAKIHENILELIGNTPLVKLNKINDGYADVVVKLEYFNPANSVKDRAALNMIEQAEKDGLLDKDTVIIEPTSGNTGIGLALVCAVRGYKLILTMPESMSAERRKMLSAYGADIVLTSAEAGMKGAVNEAMRIAEHFPKSFIPSQFSNPANPQIHELTTAQEIIKDTDGKVDIFVASFGTGGTASGVGKALKKFNKDIKIVAIEPEESPLITQGIARPHGIQGIGANFIPQNLNMDVIDEVATVSTKHAIETAINMSKKEAICCGISSGANVYAALELSRKEENKGKLIVAMTCDYGERYLSTPLFDTTAVM